MLRNFPAVYKHGNAIGHSAELQHYMISDHLLEGAAKLPDKVTDGLRIRSRNSEDRAALLIREVNPGH